MVVVAGDPAGRSSGPAQARLADGVSLETASAEANTLGLQLRGIEAEPGAEPRFEVVRTLDELTAAVAPALRVLVVAVGVVLAIVCTNVANLLLVRGTRRQQEIAIRRSLGATRGRIMRQVLTESLVLVRVRGRSPRSRSRSRACGCSSSRRRRTSTRGSAFAPSVLPRLDEIAIDPAVLAFVVVLSVVTGVLFGLLPALRLSKYGEHGHASAVAALDARAQLASRPRARHGATGVRDGAADRRRPAREQLPEAHGHRPRLRCDAAS